MRGFIRPGGSLLALVMVVGAATAQAQTQTKAQAPSTTPASAAAKGAVAAPTNTKQVLATVNNEPITKGDFLNLVVRYQLPTNDPQVYIDGMDTLVNVKLLNQFLTRQRLPVSQEKIDADLEQLKKELQSDGNDLNNALATSGTTVDDVKRELGNRQRWVEYVKLKATDAELKRFVAQHQDLFNGTQIRVSHILLKVDPNAPAAEKEKVRQRLLQIKKDIDSNKYTFAEAANKFSEDPHKTEGDGGDIGYIDRQSGILEEFADAAFKLQLRKGVVSDPVETVHGYHLIQVTDRKDGQKFDLEAKKPFAMQVYGMELQKQIIQEARKNAKIEVKPMPPDLFPPAATAPASTTPGTGKAAAPKP